jgi:two-component system, chemotaxis family, CheB/CheR fusion protein
MPKNGRKPVKKAGRAKPRGAKPVAAERLDDENFPVVGIGASAGGLEAFTKLLQNLPANTGMAFVLIQHLDPKHESILASLLARASSMPVHEAGNNMQVEPNCVYVIPPKVNLTLDGSTLHLTARLGPREHHLPVDHFFESLARSRKHRAIGVILSGTASDGTAGLRQIKTEGGITFAQDQGSAKYDGMPRSASAAGVVDYVLRPQDIARELVRISRHPYLVLDPQAPAPKILVAGKDDLNKIFSLMKAYTGCDFSLYKRATIERRLRRRMALMRIENIPRYIKLLQENRDEVKALYEDFLINVTEFFRDSGTFEVLKNSILPEMLKDRKPDTPIRIWSPGCSTGEESYSLAMLLVSCLAEHDARNPVQLFGTDISEIAIAKARIGLYSESAVAKIPQEYFHRFFTKVDHGYQISKRIREVCVFARHDLGKDPPFSRMDLISCRNVLIYLGNDLQNRVIPMFHYALKPGGYLLLGSAETVGDSPLFTGIDKSHKIYAKQAGSDRPAIDYPQEQSNGATAVAAAREEPAAQFDLQKEADRLVLAKYGPAGVVINEKMEILHFRGDISPYLRPASGPASLNFLKMLREEIITDVSATVDLARRGSVPVRREGLRVHTGELHPMELNVEILPVEASPDQDRLFLVLFEAVPARETAPVEEIAGKEIGRLRDDLAASRKHLQFLMDERQASEEELRSANEEILSSNEELQSTNEELETSQEELQSANEELTTVNDELQHRNTELSQLSNDLSNLLNSVNIAIVMLGNDLRIRWFTTMAEKVLNLRPTDIGRPIMEIRSNLEVLDLGGLLSGVLSDLAPKEIEAQDTNGAWYSLRVRPYRTEDNKIDGAVMALYDVDQLKRSFQEVEQARDFAQVVVETVPGPLVVLDSEFRVMIANRSFYETFELERRETGQELLQVLLRGHWDKTKLIQGLRRALVRNKAFKNLEIDGDFRGIGRRIFSVEGRSISLGETRRKVLLVAITDVTERVLADREMQTAHSKLEKNLQHAESSLRESEADLRQNRSELRALAARLLTTQEEERRRVSRELHDDLNQKLAMLEVDADRLGRQLPSAPAAVVAQVQSLRHQVADVSNDIRRVAYQLHPSVLDHLGLAVALRSYCTEFSKREGIAIKFSAKSAPEKVPEEVSLCLYRITQESLRNVAKHASAKTATVKLEAIDKRIHLSIRDNGIGFDRAASTHKGGIGLLSMKERVRLVDGEFAQKSALGQGTRIDVWAPLPKEGLKRS